MGRPFRGNIYPMIAAAIGFGLMPPLGATAAADDSGLPRVAFFGFQLINTSLEPTTPIENGRVKMLDDLFQEKLDHSGRFKIVPIPSDTQQRIAAGPEIERLIQLLARLPGLGPRSARRAALFLIKKRELLMAPLATALQAAMEKIEICRVCGNIDTQNPCAVCTDARREPSMIVVVADVADLWALERARALNARYHVLGGTLSPLDGVGPDDLTIDALVKRAHDPAVKEIILALNATVDGQSTAHYITDLLHDAEVKVTRLAHGVPVGGELDYLDEGTLAAAIRSRTPF